MNSVIENKLQTFIFLISKPLWGTIMLMGRTNTQVEIFCLISLDYNRDHLSWIDATSLEND